MHIGIDISVIRIAQAGVLTYHRQLVDHLIAEAPAHFFTLLDVLPLNEGRPQQAQLLALDAPHVRVARISGLRRGYLSVAPGLRAGPLHRLAARLDNALNPAWDLAARAIVALQLRAALRGVAVFHSSDQFFYRPPGAAAVLTIHDLSTLDHPELHIAGNTAMHDAKNHFAVEHADQLIAVSQATRDALVRHLGVPAERVSVVYEAAGDEFQPLTPDQAAPTLARYLLQYGSYMLSLGTLEPRKNYPRLIAAHAQLRVAHPDIPPLVIAGGRGWLYQEIESAVELHAPHVRLLGRVPDADLPALLSGATLFIYPSLYEGFGLPALEALACGTPVVVSNTTALPEVVGEAGVYCAPEDSRSIAAAMLQVLQNDALSARLRLEGPVRAARFSWRRMARETLDVYGHAVQNVVRKRHANLHDPSLS